MADDEVSLRQRVERLEQMSRALADTQLELLLAATGVRRDITELVTLVGSIAHLTAGEREQLRRLNEHSAEHAARLDQLRQRATYQLLEETQT